MLRSLRLKFIALNMAVVAMVLSVAFGAICYLTYSQDAADVESMMRETLVRAADAKVLVYDDMTLLSPGSPNPDEGRDNQGGNAIESRGEGDIRHPEIGGGEASRAELTPIAAYEVDGRGVVVSLPSFSTAFIPDAYLDEAVSAALVAKEDFGNIGGLGLLYGRLTERGVAYLTFADTSAASGWKDLATTLALVGALALLGFLVISVFFSRWALRPVETAWDQQRRFVADASHELKTPISVILANSAILRGHGDESVASQSQWLESTQVEAKRMQALVSDMLELTQLDGAVEARAGFSSVDLSDLVETEILQFESVAFELGLHIEGEVEPEVQVRGDAVRLQRMVRTLVDNACKYADGGSTVWVRLQRDTRLAKLEVANVGSPIADEDLPRIFDRFYRADKSRSRETGGHGLGLSIAHEITRIHEGDIKVTSTPEDGTVFTVTLPIN